MKRARTSSPRNPSARSPRLVAMDALARREHSRYELMSRLSERFDLDREELELVLDELEQDGLLSDRRFAESFVRYRAGRGQGRVRIRYDLRARGVGDELVSSALQSEGVDWFALAADVLVRRFGPAAPDNYSERAKRMRFLQQRGFSGDEIQAALESLGEEG